MLRSLLFVEFQNKSFFPKIYSSDYGDILNILDFILKNDYKGA